jgi:chromosomal replication initiation ATPase DnaA
MDVIEKIRIILNTVCYGYEIKPIAIKGKNRQSNIREARQLVAYFVREYTGLSFPKVGFVINRDHATVMHSIKVVKSEIEFNKDYRRKYELINEIIKTRIDG